MITELFAPIDSIDNIGEKRSRAYKKLGIETPYDLLYHFPRSYIDFSHPVSILDIAIGNSAVVSGIVKTKSHAQVSQKGTAIYKAVVSEYNVDFEVIIYNSSYLFDTLKIGKKYYFYGKVTGNILKKQVQAPQIVSADDDFVIKPVYPLTTGLTSDMVRRNMKSALNIFINNQFDNLPKEIIIKNGLVPLADALTMIHYPKTIEDINFAKRRLVFDEMLIIQLGMYMLRNKNNTKTAYRMHDLSMKELTKSMPFELTSAQKKSIIEICSDMCNETPMNRLLQGDVGSGKTAVAAYACYFAFKNGYQSALMAPTEILAIQHFKTLSSYLEPLGVKVGLLTGSLKAKEKNELKRQLLIGEISVIVGTHAIIQKNIEYKDLALVITDEQHRFGVAQRTALAEKGGTPHKLVMSATPIPRTMALLIYGDLEISVLDELPKGRMPIETYAVTGKLRERSYTFVKKRIDESRQAYIVCPMIEDSDSELQAVCSYAEGIAKGSFKDYRVGLLHGRLKGEVKEQVMNDFKNGDIDVLVCTTVVEVGVDVPNAVVMIIEDCERFGLSQLHQLRGRVGRGNEQSYCILITDHVGDEVMKRIKIISNTNNGFDISEADLKLRGPGDFFGQKQHGLPALKIAQLSADMDIINLAQKNAREILEEDPELTTAKYGGLKMEVIKLFAKNGENGLN